MTPPVVPSDDAGAVVTKRIATVHSATLRGALWITAGAVISTGMVYFVRLSATSLPAVEVAFFRGLFGMVIVLPFMIRIGRAAAKSYQPLLQLGRGLNASLIMGISFYVIAHLPLAQVTALSFSRPLFVLILAAIFLSERLRWFRSVATLVGFVGVLIIVRPGADMNPVALLAVLTAALIACNIIMVKKLARTDRTETMLFYSTLVQALALAIPTALIWQTPSWEELGYLIGVGICGTGMQACMVRGYRIAEASALAPFDYSRLLFTAALGYFAFAEVPDFWTWVGAGVIIAATLYIAQREARLSREEPL